MKAEDVKVDFEKLKEQKRKNFQERIWFIKYWAKFIREHPDEEWSKGQAVLIDSQHENAKWVWENYDKFKTIIDKKIMLKK